MPTISISPLTRIEGHLDIRADVSTAGVVNSAQSAGTMFRGFETILRGRDPRDAPHLTQRICGVCPISHGMASTTALEAAFGIRPADNGRILRNLVLASNFLQSHILHFYHLTLLDYVDAANTPLDKTPWRPAYTSADMLRGTEATPFINNYVAALEHRRLAHQMAAIFGGKMPCAPTLVPGGCSEQVTDKKLRDFRDLLARLKSFVEGQLIPDADRLAAKFRSYFSIGRGAGNLLTYGVFDLNAQGSEKLFKPGRMVAGKPQPFDPAKIQEYVRYSYYEGSTAGAHPTQGDTRPVLNLGKADAYSWIKAPRYDAAVYEVGPLARMTVNGDYKNGVSVMDRIVARARECRKLIDAMTTWLGQLRPGAPTTTRGTTPVAADGVGLTEAPRGALGHWIRIANSKIERYQILAPTGWNASPKDGVGRGGAIEQALLGARLANADQPIELLRIVHSFDPCLACSVHAIRAKPREIV